MKRTPLPQPSFLALSLGYSYSLKPEDNGERIKVTTRPEPPPHAFVSSGRRIRRPGSIMRNPPAPAGPNETMLDPLCVECRRWKNHEIHDVMSNHDRGDEDRS